MKTNSDQRDERINIRISSDMRSRAQVVADNMGIPLSTVTAVALAEYVQAKENAIIALHKPAEMTAKSTADVISDFLKDPDFINTIVGSQVASVVDQVDIEEFTKG